MLRLQRWLIAGPDDSHWDADGRRSVQPVEAYVAVLAPVCSQLGSALAVYVATRTEIRRRGAFGRRL